MIYAILAAWIIAAILIVIDKKIARIIIYLAIFSLLSSAAYMFLGSPDVAMAEAATSVFTTVFFIICFKRYFVYKDKHHDHDPSPKRRVTLKMAVKFIVPFVFTLSLLGLFLHVVPSDRAQTGVWADYLAGFAQDIGGENTVTAIYLGYRVYDTLFEALILVISVVAVIHVSHTKKLSVRKGEHSEMEKSGMAVFAIRVICPVMLLFGVYLIVNGHISPGGGFQGGLAIASFFICRYLIYDIYDLPIKKINTLEDFIFTGIVLIAVFIVFLGFAAYIPPNIRPMVQTVYMIAMNALIGLKVACGFIILFYRYIAIESR